LSEFALACEADAKGRTGLETRPYPQADYLLSAAEVAASVDTSALMDGKLQGAQIGEAIRCLRIQAITHMINAEQFNIIN
jgi:tRNA nucleotidyltransferase (CCA-adding enzyme)